jgi:histidinol dehydrogenase
MMMGERVRPVASAGVHVPGFSAPLFATIAMSVEPAKAAGVERICIATPPRKDGTINPLVLVAAAECGVDEIYRFAGAQAVAALAFGTETVEPVSVIVGPGNPYVTAAKRMVYGHVGIDNLAGPSESMIIADGHADPRGWPRTCSRRRNTPATTPWYSRPTRRTSRARSRRRWRHRRRSWSARS